MGLFADLENLELDITRVQNFDALDRANCLYHFMLPLHKASDCNTIPVRLASMSTLQEKACA